MAIYLGATQIDGTGSGGGGGAIPNIDTFTTSGTWTVPDTVKDKVTNDGHCEIGLFIVGGGSGTTTASNAATRSGEIINKVYKLTSADYDDPSASNPVVTIIVGASGGFSGITNDGLSTHTQTQSGLVDNVSGDTMTPAVSFDKDSNNYIKMASGDFSYWYFVNYGGWTLYNINKSYTGFASGVTVDTSTYSAGFKLTFQDEIPYDGVMTVTCTQSRVDYPTINYTVVHKWNTANQRFETTVTATGTSAQYYYLGNRYHKIHFSRGVDVGLKARAGDHADFAEFQNNPYDPYGFNGFAKNATHNSLSNSRYSSSYYGSPGQGGYIEIYY